MKRLVKVSVITSLLFSILACNVGSSVTKQPNKIALTDEKPIVILDTGNSDYPRIAFFQGGEVIIPNVNFNQDGQIAEVQGAIFVTADGKSIYFYFENGLPVRAIAEDHLIQFENFSENTVDVTVVAPDGSITLKTNIPFDNTKIHKSQSHGNVHLAKLSMTSNNQDIDWLSFTSTAIGAFSCAATVATGGTLSVLFGVGCGIFIYTTYMKVVGKEAPVAIQGAGTLVSGVSCATGIIQKEPISAGECVDVVLDVADMVTKKSQSTEQKLITMVGANPNTKNELANEATLEPAIVETPGLSQPPECAQLNLTPEELANCGDHQYAFDSCSLKSEYGGMQCCVTSASGPSTAVWNFSFTENGLVSTTKLSENSYTYTQEAYGQTKKTIITFTSDGFISQTIVQSANSGCEYAEEWILAK